MYQRLLWVNTSHLMFTLILTLTCVKKNDTVNVMINTKQIKNNDLYLFDIVQKTLGVSRLFDTQPETIGIFTIFD